MPEKAIFHLFIPSLIQELNTWFRDFSFEAQAPHLSKLLCEFTKVNQDNSFGFEMAFFRFLDSKIQELPSAYYRNQIHNKNIQDRLMCADPIHLEVGMNDVTLTNKITDLTNSEAKELILLLNSHFKQDGLEFIFGSNQCWYVSHSGDEAIESHPLDSMLMQNVIDKQAKSEHRNWQIIQNETQMLLHSSEINHQREMAGLETINSLWFWGAGKPIIPNTEMGNIYCSKESSSSLRSQYFAKAADCELKDSSGDLNQVLVEVGKNKKSQVFLLDQLIIPSKEKDFDEFQIQLTQIDKQIIKPLLQAWKNNTIDIQIHCCNGSILKPLRPSLFKFWLKPQNLREIANETGS